MNFMPQCPSCKSYTGSDSAFCSQCGAWLGGPRAPRHARRRVKLPLITAILILAVLSSVVVVLFLPYRHGGQSSGKPSLARKDGGEALVDAVAGAAIAVDDARGTARTIEPDEPEVLDAARSTRLIVPALVVLDLRAEDDRPLRETRGVIVEPSGVVLCRLRPLLGAHHGACRLSRPEGERAEILGLCHSVEALDLALIRIARSPNGYAAVSLLEDPPVQTLKAGDAVFVTNAGRAQEAAVEESYYVSADRVIRVLLSESLSVPAESFLVLDAYGFVVGLCKLEVEGQPIAEGKPRPSKGYRVLVDPSYSLAQGLGRDASLTLNELTLRLYQGTFDDYFTRATGAYKQKRWKEAIDLFEQALGRVAQDQPDDEDVAQATANLRDSYVEESQRLLAAKRMEEAAQLAANALRRFGDDATLMVTLGEARLAQREWAAGIAALAQAHDIEPSGHVDSLLEKAYLEIAGEAGKAGDARTQESHLLQGIQRLPGAALLHLELGKLYAKFEAYDDAIRMLQRAGELDASLKDTVESLLAKIDDALKHRDALVIGIPPGSRSIRADAVIDGTTQYTFTIDTGATYTVFPYDLAVALGYAPDSPRVPRIPVMGVSGPTQLPLIRIGSLSIGGYSVRNLDVLVNEKGLSRDVALIGLNFLKHFKYTVDQTRNEFRLERP